MLIIYVNLPMIFCDISYIILRKPVLYLITLYRIWKLTVSIFHVPFREADRHN